MIYICTSIDTVCNIESTQRGQSASSLRVITMIGNAVLLFAFIKYLTHTQTQDKLLNKNALEISLCLFNISPTLE